jgi:hypothetical protein
MRYLTLVFLFLLAGCGEQYSHVSTYGCGTVANNLERVVVAKLLGETVNDMIQANEMGVRACWAKLGPTGCAIQDEAGLTWLKQKIQYIYHHEVDVHTYGDDFYNACVKEKGIQPGSEADHLPKGPNT